MVSNKQEKYDLMHDNPVAKDASGGRGGSWMSKHSQSRMGGGSPLNKVKPEAKSKKSESEWSGGSFDPYGDTDPFDTK